MSDEAEAPGWDAIDDALRAVYGSQQPQHWGTVMHERVLFGGPHALDGVSAYTSTAPVPHGHYVSYGLTDLYADKDGDDPDRSGWGFELTIRTPRVDEAPPMWPVNLLLNLAGYVHRNGKVLTPGHWFDAGPVTDTADSDVTGYGFVADIDLEPIDTPHGRVEFLQVVGLRPEELRLWAEDGAEAWLTIARERLPGLLTEPRRPSLL